MSAISDTPVNKNFLSPLNFKFSLRRAPYVNFFIQKVNLPGITLPSFDQPNPFVNIPQAGDHIKFEELDITFKVDEELVNYLEIHNWIRALGFPDNFGQYDAIEEQPVYSGNSITSDISLHILESTKTAGYNARFIDAFPTSLSQLEFRSTDIDVNFITASAKFKYTYYTLSKYTDC